MSTTNTAKSVRPRVLGLSSSSSAAPCPLCNGSGAAMRCDDCDITCCKKCDDSIHKLAANQRHRRVNLDINETVSSVPSSPFQMQPLAARTSAAPPQRAVMVTHIQQGNDEQAMIPVITARPTSSLGRSSPLITTTPVDSPSNANLTTSPTAQKPSLTSTNNYHNNNSSDNSINITTTSPTAASVAASPSSPITPVPSCPMCSLCSLSVSTVYCGACNLTFCTMNECDQRVHETHSKQDHQRVKIEEMEAEKQRIQQQSSTSPSNTHKSSSSSSSSAAEAAAESAAAPVPTPVPVAAPAAVSAAAEEEVAAPAANPSPAPFPAPAPASVSDDAAPSSPHSPPSPSSSPLNSSNNEPIQVPFTPPEDDTPPPPSPNSSDNAHAAAPSSSVVVTAQPTSPSVSPTNESSTHPIQIEIQAPSEHAASYNQEQPSQPSASQPSTLSQTQTSFSVEHSHEDMDSSMDASASIIPSPKPVGQLCDLCEEKTCDVYCPNCEMYLCNKDDHDLHKPSNSKWHVRVPYEQIHNHSANEPATSQPTPQPQPQAQAQVSPQPAQATPQISQASPQTLQASPVASPLTSPQAASQNSHIHHHAQPAPHHPAATSPHPAKMLSPALQAITRTQPDSHSLSTLSSPAANFRPRANSAFPASTPAGLSALHAATVANQQAPLCDICERAKSVLVCNECEMNLCLENNCDQELHRPSKMSHHVRTPIGAKTLALASFTPIAHSASRPSSRAPSPEPHKTDSHLHPRLTPSSARVGALHHDNISHDASGFAASRARAGSALVTQAITSPVLLGRNPLLFAQNSNPLLNTTSLAKSHSVSQHPHDNHTHSQSHGMSHLSIQTASPIAVSQKSAPFSAPAHHAQPNTRVSSSPHLSSSKHTPTPSPPHSQRPALASPTSNNQQETPRTARTGSRLCTLCEDVRAERYCAECNMYFCLADDHSIHLPHRLENHVRVALSAPICSLCDVEQATFWCQDCKQFFCQTGQCDQQYHQPIKLQHHQRARLDSAPVEEEALDRAWANKPQQVVYDDSTASPSPQTSVATSPAPSDPETLPVFQLSNVSSAIPSYATSPTTVPQPVLNSSAPASLYESDQRPVARPSISAPSSIDNITNPPLSLSNSVSSISPPPAISAASPPLLPSPSPILASSPLSSPSSSPVPLCERCDKVPSVFWCEECEIQLCTPCNDVLHQSNAGRNHVRRMVRDMDWREEEERRKKEEEEAKQRRDAAEAERQRLEAAEELRIALSESERRQRREEEERKLQAERDRQQAEKDALAAQRAEIERQKAALAAQRAEAEQMEQQLKAEQRARELQEEADRQARIDKQRQAQAEAEAQRQRELEAEEIARKEQLAEQERHRLQAEEERILQEQAAEEQRIRQELEEREREEEECIRQAHEYEEEQDRIAQQIAQQQESAQREAEQHELQASDDALSPISSDEFELPPLVDPQPVSSPPLVPRLTLPPISMPAAAPHASVAAADAARDRQYAKLDRVASQSRSHSRSLSRDLAFFVPVPRQTTEQVLDSARQQIEELSSRVQHLQNELTESVQLKSERIHSIRRASEKSAEDSTINSKYSTVTSKKVGSPSKSSTNKPLQPPRQPASLLKVPAKLNQPASSGSSAFSTPSRSADTSPSPQARSRSPSPSPSDSPSARSLLSSSPSPSPIPKPPALLSIASTASVAPSDSPDHMATIRAELAEAKQALQQFQVLAQQLQLQIAQHSQQAQSSSNFHMPQFVSTPGALPPYGYALPHPMYAPYWGGAPMPAMPYPLHNTVQTNNLHSPTTTNSAPAPFNITPANAFTAPIPSITSPSKPSTDSSASNTALTPEMQRSLTDFISKTIQQSFAETTRHLKQDAPDSKTDKSERRKKSSSRKHGHFDSSTRDSSLKSPVSRSSSRARSSRYPVGETPPSMISLSNTSRHTSSHSHLHSTGVEHSKVLQPLYVPADSNEPAIKPTPTSKREQSRERTSTIDPKEEETKREPIDITAKYPFSKSSSNSKDYFPPSSQVKHLPSLSPLPPISNRNASVVLLAPSARDRTTNYSNAALDELLGSPDDSLDLDADAPANSTNSQSSSVAALIARYRREAESTIQAAKASQTQRSKSKHKKDLSADQPVERDTSEQDRELDEQKRRRERREKRRLRDERRKQQQEDAARLEQPSLLPPPLVNNPLSPVSASLHQFAFQTAQLKAELDAERQARQEDAKMIHFYQQELQLKHQQQSTSPPPVSMKDEATDPLPDQLIQSPLSSNTSDADPSNQASPAQTSVKTGKSASLPYNLEKLSNLFISPTYLNAPSHASDYPSRSPPRTLSTSNSASTFSYRAGRSPSTSQLAPHARTHSSPSRHPSNFAPAFNMPTITHSTGMNRAAVRSSSSASLLSPSQSVRPQSGHSPSVSIVLSPSLSTSSLSRPRSTGQLHRNQHTASNDSLPHRINTRSSMDSIQQQVMKDASKLYRQDAWMTE